MRNWKTFELDNDFDQERELFEWFHRRRCFNIICSSVNDDTTIVTIEPKSRVFNILSKVLFTEIPVKLQDVVYTIK